jgi:hypothetical protein
VDASSGAFNKILTTTTPAFSRPLGVAAGQKCSKKLSEKVMSISKITFSIPKIDMPKIEFRSLPEDKTTFDIIDYFASIMPPAMLKLRFPSLSVSCLWDSVSKREETTLSSCCLSIEVILEED